MIFSDITECMSAILENLEDIINKISQSRQFENPVTMGTFPNFEEMGLIQKAIDNPSLHGLADRILSFFPTSLTDLGRASAFPDALF